MIEETGPVIWKNIHTNASKCLTDEDRKKFMDYLIFLKDNFPCDRCKPHFDEYLRKNMPKYHTDLFFWTVEFHNCVNRRLGKKEMDIIQACNIYKYKQNSFC